MTESWPPNVQRARDLLGTRGVQVFETTERAEGAGLTVTDLRTARCRVEFFDVGAVVWILRKCVWWVPGFSVGTFRDKLLGLNRQMRDGQPLIGHSTRHLIEARR